MVRFPEGIATGATGEAHPDIRPRFGGLLRAGWVALFDMAIPVEESKKPRRLTRRGFLMKSLRLGYNRRKCCGVELPVNLELQEHLV